MSKEELETATLDLLWRAATGGDEKLKIETVDEEGPDGVGPEYWVDDRVAVWPEIMTRPGHDSITGRTPDTEVIGWVIADLVHENNYPHEPDGIDYANTQHFFDSTAMLPALVLKVIQARMFDRLESLADDLLAEELRHVG